MCIPHITFRSVSGLISAILTVGLFNFSNYFGLPVYTSFVRYPQSKNIECDRLEDPECNWTFFLRPSAQHYHLYITLIKCLVVILCWFSLSWRCDELTLSCVVFVVDTQLLTTSKVRSNPLTLLLKWRPKYMWRNWMWLYQNLFFRYQICFRTVFIHFHHSGH